MKRNWFLALALMLSSCRAPGERASQPSSDLNLPPPITSYVAAREVHARMLEGKLKVKVHDDYWKFFRQARLGSWPGANSTFDSLRQRTCLGPGSTNEPMFDRTVWQPVVEVMTVLEYYTPSNNAPKWSTAFGEGILKSIPRESIFFGGNGLGRGVPVAFSGSHADGEPFYTLTQNALADGSYLQYLRHIYDGKIQLPSNEDSQRCFQAYLDDAQKRLQHDKDFPNEPRQLKPGEDVGIVNDRVQVSGHVAVMALNALLAKVIFDKNPEREFYVEESFPLDWMYPYLTPHGLIMKINREPAPSFSPEFVAKDREFWTRQQAPLIGDWLTPDTSVKEVCEFVEKVFVAKDLSGFRGDPAFIRSDNTTKMYSKVRGSIGGLYNWRIEKAQSPDEKRRMAQEADFAFRQSFALCPTSPEAIYRYINLLVQLQRIDDSLLIARTAQRLNPKDSQIQNLITELERMRGAVVKPLPGEVRPRFGASRHWPPADSLSPAPSGGEGVHRS